ncbi:MAG: alpha/beta fold hydrolase [Micromonosporaceae bacterium]|nr:alpha/beta fold hydrolase [Micromonosporaceae bacterium]
MLRAGVPALVVALVAAGCTFGSEPTTRGTTSARPEPGAAPGPTWRPCDDVADDLVGPAAARARVRYQCTTIKVPQDWAAAKASPGASPSGPTFDIAVIRARSERQHDRIGSLLVNPGGPGGSGVDLAVYLSVGAGLGGLPLDVLERFDIVGFDPRGVGRSSPVKCISDADLDATFGYEPDPVSQEEFDGLVDLARRIGQTCGAKYGDSLRLYSTEQAARDMDAVRAAVGDAKITYLGYSYGTLLGATYAQLFPTHIRALVLDGAVDPQQDLVAASESQAKGFERAFSNFAAWCRENRSDCPIAPDARTAVTAALDKARSSPARGRDGREATAGWVFYAVISSLYSESGWQRLASAIARLETGDPDEVFELADSYAERRPDGTYSNLFDAFSAVGCADSDEVPSLAEIRKLQSQWRAKYPLFGAPQAVGLLSCALWPGKRDPVPTGPAKGAPPIVVVGTTGDPATPYEQTARLADMLGVGVVLTWQGEGHTAYPATRCINNAVDRYLIDLKVPRKGLTCPAR